MNKYNTTKQKSRDLRDRTLHTIEDHREMNAERFYKRDEGLKRVSQEREDFLQREDKRHQSKLEQRDKIIRDISLDHEQKKEMRKLRVMDASFNQEQERRKKQEF